jgi:hypothetical protein
MRVIEMIFEEIRQRANTAGLKLEARLRDRRYLLTSNRETLFESSDLYEVDRFIDELAGV